MYTEEMNRVFNAPRGHKKIQLHKGFWGAYKAIDAQLTAEIYKQVLMLKVRQQARHHSTTAAAVAAAAAAAGCWQRPLQW
jgi:hypothetical protein